MKHERIVLAYSGGLDTSAILVWLRNHYKAKITAYCCDVGHLPDRAVLEAQAERLGADEFIFEDLKETFVQNYVFPSVRAGAIYQREYLLGTAIARPLIAERIARKALASGATAIAHGATGKGNDQLRFEKAWAYLTQEIQIIAPWKIWDFEGRTDLIRYMKEQGLDYEASVAPAYSVDSNLLHRSCEGGILEDPSKSWPENEILEWTRTESKTGPTEVQIGFREGIPVSLDGRTLSPASLLAALNQAGSAHGIGVEDLVEERMNGIKSRGVYETPGGTILHKAMQKLRQICWSKELLMLAGNLGDHYGNLVYDGLWHSQARLALESFFTRAGQSLTGEIGLRLFQGQMRVTKRFSPFSLYSQKIVSFEEDSGQINKAASGYCKTVTFPVLQEGRIHGGFSDE